jgi:hypothetical protein
LLYPRQPCEFAPRVHHLYSSQHLSNTTPPWEGFWYLYRGKPHWYPPRAIARLLTTSEEYPIPSCLPLIHVTTATAPVMAGRWIDMFARCSGKTIPDAPKLLAQLITSTIPQCAQCHPSLLSPEYDAPLTERAGTQEALATYIDPSYTQCTPQACATINAAQADCESSQESLCDGHLLRAALIAERAGLSRQTHPDRTQMYKVMSTLLPGSRTIMPLLPNDLLDEVSWNHPVRDAIDNPIVRSIYDSQPRLFRSWIRLYDRLLVRTHTPYLTVESCKVWWQLLHAARLIVDIPECSLAREYMSPQTCHALRHQHAGHIANDVNCAYIKARITSILSLHVVMFLTFPFPIYPGFATCGCHICRQACTCTPTQPMLLHCVSRCLVPLLDAWDVYTPSKHAALTRGQCALLGLIPEGAGSFRSYVHC